MLSFQDTAHFFRPLYVSGVELVSVEYSQRSFPVHTHDDYLLGTVLTGAEKLTVGTHEYVVGNGDVLFLNPGEAHSNETIGPDILRYIVFYISPWRLKALLGEANITGLPLFTNTVTYNQKLADTLIQTYNVLTSNSSNAAEQQSAMLGLIKAVSITNAASVGTLTEGTCKILAVKDWIDLNFTECSSLEYMAAQSRLSAFYFAHRFKSLVGLSPIAYRNQLRIQAARRLLIGGQSIAQVAAMVGFADQSHLSRQFQKIVGTSPKRYQQQECSRHE